jgi:uncharacterized protein (DUF1015 family)
MSQMADFLPFAALRYDASIAGDPAALIAPPYDVVSAGDRAALYARSPYNVSHVDYGEERPTDTDADSRYTRARSLLEAWLAKGVLTRDERPALYAYDQEFVVEGEKRRRRAVFGRLRVEEWDRGIVLPHERTLEAPKADRLRLLQETRVNLSPIMVMYRNDSGAPLVGNDDLESVVLDASLIDGERHVLSRLKDDSAARFCQAMSDRKLYVADGHHRYETALAYRDERRAAASNWTGEEPENFVLAALVDSRDPGLVVLPIHRVIRLERPVEDAVTRLKAYFSVEEMTMRNDGGAVPEMMQRLRMAGAVATAIGVAGLTRRTLQLLQRQGRVGDELLPSGHAEAWRDLDVNVLHHIVFPAIGYEAVPDAIEFTEDYRHAAAAVISQRDTVAFLLNPTRPDQILACADAGERMPQKTTFFFPKLATGIVLYPLD